MSDARLLVDTLRLSPPADAGSLRAAWARANVGALLALVDAEGAAVWLQRRLAALGIALADVQSDRLTRMAKRIVAQMMRIDAETANVVSLLRSAGIPVAPIKAVAMRRLTGRVPYADARGASDIDVLVPERQAKPAWDFIAAHGFTARPPTPTVHHLPVLVGPSGVALEIHTSIAAVVPADEAWLRATGEGVTVDFLGAPLLVPSDTELLWHAVNHGVKHAYESARHGVRLSKLIDASALLAAGAPIDWARIRARIESDECWDANLVRAWFHAAADFSGQSLATGALGGAQGPALNVERLLRWRLRVARPSGGSTRWHEKLLEEGTRGEAMMSVSPPAEQASPYARVRHRVASAAARAWWLLRR